MRDKRWLVIETDEDDYKIPAKLTEYIKDGLAYMLYDEPTCEIVADWAKTASKGDEYVLPGGYIARIV